MAADCDAEMFRPPIARGMKVLDRAFFKKTLPLTAARVFERKDISKVRSELERSRDALHQDRLGSVYSDPDPERAQRGQKCVLLRPEVARFSVSTNGVPRPAIEEEAKDSSTSPYSPVLSELVSQDMISIIPFQLELDYSYWTYHDIVSAILPLDVQDEIPSGFSQVGHVAHLNLRNEYLPYKSLISEIILDKNPNVRTVINKIDDVGQENEFRTFKYEVIAGPDDMNVTVSEANCTFGFDYSKVYWNTRLQTEHSRLVSMFKEGEAVCDVMAGIGPFAVPAGKKGVFVWANDLNPESYGSLVDAISRNKAGDFVRPFNADGRNFIRSAAAELLQTEHSVELKKKQSRKAANKPPIILSSIKQPKTFQHFVLNLPASALTFLPSFIGLYPPELRAKLPKGTLMPLIHVYCFGSKDELSISETNGSIPEDGRFAAMGDSAIGKICVDISQQLQYEMHAGSLDQGGVEVYDVRDVAPKKRMFCATFRLPEEVAFRDG